MTRRVYTARPASQELAAAIRWYEERRTGLGGEFYEAIVRTLDRTASLHASCGELIGVGLTRDKSPREGVRDRQAD